MHEAELEAARAEREVWARNAVSETRTTTPVSITQSLSALHVEHAHLLEEHGAGRVVLRQREAVLADFELEAREATRVAEDRATWAESIAALDEREVGFLKALNTSYASEEAVQGPGYIDQAKEGHVKELENLVNSAARSAQDGTSRLV